MSKVLFLSRCSLRKFTGCRKESPWCNEDSSSARVLSTVFFSFFSFLFFRGRVFPSRCGFSLKGRRKELVALAYTPCVHDSFVAHKRFASGTTWERIFVTFGLSFGHVFDGCCRDKETVSVSFLDTKIYRFNLNGRWFQQIYSFRGIKIIDFLKASRKNILIIRIRFME